MTGRYPKRRVALMRAWKIEREEEHARYEAEYPRPDEMATVQ
jgi:hypothetical protein